MAASGVLLPAFNCEIATNGYLAQLGLHYENVINRFNLSGKIMEATERTVAGGSFNLKTADLLRRIERYGDELAFLLIVILCVSDAPQLV